MEKKYYTKTTRAMIIALSLSFVFTICGFISTAGGSEAGFVVGTALIIIGSCASFTASIMGIWLWVYGYRYEKIVNQVRAGEEAEALDALYAAAKLESNNTIINSDELAEIAKKAKIKLNFE